MREGGGLWRGRAWLTILERLVRIFRAIANQQFFRIRSLEMSTGALSRAQQGGQRRGFKRRALRPPTPQGLVDLQAPRNHVEWDGTSDSAIDNELWELRFGWATQSSFLRVLWLQIRMCLWIWGSFRFEVPALVHAWGYMLGVNPRLDADDPVEFEKLLFTVWAAGCDR